MKTIDTTFKLWVHLVMNKRPVLSVILIIIIFTVIPIAFWIVSSNKKISDDVKGAETSSGAIVKIISKNGSWDMYKYLCNDRSECLESLSSGKMVEKTSGGGIDDQFVSLGYFSDWSSYKFLKIYVESGWGSIERFFSAQKSDSFDNVVIQSIESNGKNYQIVLIPIEILDQSSFQTVSFTDN